MCMSILFKSTQRQLLAKVTVVEYTRNTPDFQVWCASFLQCSLKVVPVLFDSGIARGTRECMVRCRNKLDKPLITAASAH